MNGPEPAPATFYRPAEVARMLRCSEWWVKEQARNRRIPFSWIGGSYLFTDEHIAAIVRLFEVQPTETTATAAASGRASRRNTDETDGAAIRLSARIPRRARTTATDAAA
jgi:hypothetical protein